MIILYIDADVIIKAASLLGAFGALIGAVYVVFRQIEANKKQADQIHEMQNELTIICCCMKSVLCGLIEQGCDGPCKDGLNMLDKYLNKSAHRLE